MQRKKILYRNKFKPESKVAVRAYVRNRDLLSGGLFPVSGVKQVKSG
jgi:hypothetical protein